MTACDTSVGAWRRRTDTRRATTSLLSTLLPVTTQNAQTRASLMPCHYHQHIGPTEFRTQFTGCHRYSTYALTSTKKNNHWKTIITIANKCTVRTRKMYMQRQIYGPTNCRLSPEKVAQEVHKNQDRLPYPDWHILIPKTCINNSRFFWHLVINSSVVSYLTNQSYDALLIT